MSLLLLFAGSGAAEYLVAYGDDASVNYPIRITRVAFGGDAAEGYEPTSAIRRYDVAYGGDVSDAYEPSGRIPVGLDVQHVAFGGNVSAGYPIVAFVDQGGVLVPVNASLVDRIRLWHAPSVAALEAGQGSWTELDESFARGWTTGLSDPGSWTCTMQNTDADLAAIDYGHYIVCELDGIFPFVGVVEKINTVSIAQAEEHGEVTTISGRSVLAEWERALIGPSTDPGSELYADVRHYGWMSLELLDQDWPSGRRQFRQDAVADGYEAKHGTPLGWPDPEGWWIWSAPAISYAEYLPAGVLAPDDPPLHDPGISYFRNGFSLGAAEELAIYIACDDAFEAYVDGVPIGGNGELNGWHVPFRADVPAGAGDHIIAIKAENFDRLASTNTAGLLVAIYTLDGQGNDDVLILRTGGADWEVAHLPAQPPGFTVGHLLRLLLEGAQAEGELVGWTLDFDDFADSGGNQWAPNEQFSFPVGLDLLSALMQLADTHVDFLIDRAARVLRAWRIGEAGVDAASTTATLTSGLGSLVFEGRA